nr:hypothetical protein [Phenylobacterium sp.]
MSKLSNLVSRASLAATAFALAAAPAFAQTVAAPDTRETVLPLAQRLNLMGVLTHAKPLVQLVFAGLIVAIAYAAFVYIRRIVARRDERAGGLAFLAALAAGGPLIGFFGAAYGLLDMCIGIANTRPSATLVMLAPGYAEAALCAALGLLAGAIAVIGHRHLNARLDAVGEAAPATARDAPSSSHPARAIA